MQFIYSCVKRNRVLWHDFKMTCFCVLKSWRLRSQERIYYVTTILQIKCLFWFTNCKYIFLTLTKVILLSQPNHRLDVINCDTGLSTPSVHPNIFPETPARFINAALHSFRDVVQEQNIKIRGHVHESCRLHFVTVSQAAAKNDKNLTSRKTAFIFIIYNNMLYNKKHIQ